MRKERLAVGGAVLAAVAASLCCVGPLLFVLLGLGAFSAATAFESARPYLLGAAALILAFGFYRTYFRRREACAPGEACSTRPAGRAGRAGLWVASAAVLALALAPYYVGHFAAAFVRTRPAASTPPPATATAPAAEAERPQASPETITVRVEGMSCGSCEVHIRAALEQTPGVRKADVSYERGDARVEYDPGRIDAEQIRRTISSTGYKAK